MTKDAPDSPQLVQLLASWDAQQDAYVPQRNRRFHVIAEAVQAACGPRPTILDLGCGTGTLLHMIGQKLPESTLVGLDSDPVLLRLARTRLGHAARLLDSDLLTGAWLGDAESFAPYDAIVSTTALHWLGEESLAAAYRWSAQLLRPGGIFINADTMPAALGRIGRILTVLAGTPTTDLWSSWWRAAEMSSDLAPEFAERAERGARRPPEFLPPAEWHVTALSEAGLDDAMLIWRDAHEAAVAAMASNPAMEGTVL
ncbi:class I SAM-dependent methyltransferase [Micromonospora sp. NPDC048830]|uniref:class I SAM-dependent methyltransferase n=1 Tax=Micromonospora sp. NPDC048830 TaxID=3364257 RepID=UPI003717E466